MGRKVERDVSRLDVNISCPKAFSLKGVMRAALLTQPDKVGEILTSLIGSFTIPVTAKIRLQPDPKDKLNLVDVIQDTGVAALAVHGRSKDVETIKKIAQHAKILIITNGGSSDNRNSETNTFQGISLRVLETVRSRQCDDSPGGGVQSFRVPAGTSGRRHGDDREIPGDRHTVRLPLQHRQVLCPAAPRQSPGLGAGPELSEQRHHGGPLNCVWVCDEISGGTA